MDRIRISYGTSRIGGLMTLCKQHKAANLTAQKQLAISGPVCC
jgi:hypothetical protein